MITAIANHSLGMVVVERNLRLIHKREQILAVTTQAFAQTHRLRVFPRRIDQLRQTLVQPVAARLVLPGRQFVSSPPQANRIAEEPVEFPECLRDSGFAPAPVRFNRPPQSGQFGNWCFSFRSIRWGVGCRSGLA